MGYYRCYLLDSHEKIGGVEDVESTTPDTALKESRRIFASRPHFPAFELWHGGAAFMRKTETGNRAMKRRCAPRDPTRHD